MINFMVSPITVYDEDEELYATKVGEKDRNMDLFYTAWGKNYEESRKNAFKLLQLLNANQ